MTNRIRGEAALDRRRQIYRLLLTLGALAEIESGLGLADLSEVPRGSNNCARPIWPSSRRR